MRAAQARAIYAHSFFSNMRALACLSYARIMVFHDTLIEYCISACEANIPYTFTFIYYHLYTWHRY